jgi:peptide/nickel transport system substrate-binding protein
MWDKIGIKAKLLAQPKATYFPKMLGDKSSVYLLGWAPATVDGKNVLDNLLHTPNAATGVGRFNKGGYSNPKLDELAGKAQAEPDQAKRTAMLKEALNLAHADVASIPLHFQFIIYASKKNVDLVLRPDDNFHVRWVTVK